MYEDMMIECADCGAEFVHSAEDQGRYAERGFEHPPKRCRDCREKRKANQPQGGGNRGGGGNRAPRQFSGGGNRNFDGPRPEREFHETVCSECGQTTTVPFKPKPGRPVFCRDCYRAQQA